MNYVFKALFKIWLLEEMILWVSNLFCLSLFDPIVFFWFGVWPILVLVLV